MKIYLIDDDRLRHELIPSLLALLRQLQGGINWLDGFEGSIKGNEYFDNDLLTKAVDDPDGLILLDLDLPSVDPNLYKKQIEALKAMFIVTPDMEKKYGEINDRFGNEINHQIASILATVAIKKGLKLLLITAHPSMVGHLKIEGLSYAYMPDAIESRRDANLQYLAMAIIDLVGRKRPFLPI